MESKEILSVGRSCTAILNTLIRFVFSGNSKEAADELVKLKGEGVFFATRMEGLLSEQESLERYFIKKEAHSKQDISDCLRKLLMLKEELASFLSDLERKTVVLFYFKSMHETFVDKAMKVMSKEEQVILGNAIYGSFGVLTDPPVEVATEELNHNKEAKIKFSAEQYKNECKVTEEAISIIQGEILERKTLINRLEIKLDILQKERESYSKKLTQIKEKIVFLVQAVEFWSLMHLLSEEDVNYAKLTTTVFKKATEKNRKISSSKPVNKYLAHTFIEAWDSELIKAEKGLPHALHFSFTCSRCGGTFTSAAHMLGGSLHCAACKNAKGRSPMRHS